MSGSGPDTFWLISDPGVSLSPTGAIGVAGDALSTKVTAGLYDKKNVWLTGKVTDLSGVSDTNDEDTDALYAINIYGGTGAESNGQYAKVSDFEEAYGLTDARAWGIVFIGYGSNGGDLILVKYDGTKWTDNDDQVKRKLADSGVTYYFGFDTATQSYTPEAAATDEEVD